MRFISCFFLLTIIFSHCGEPVSPTLLPSSVEKTIQRLNYCLNNIDRDDIFGSLSQIMIGKAEENFDELRTLINQNQREKTAQRDNIDRYRKFAKNLKIKVVKIQIDQDRAIATTLFFNINFLSEDKRKILLKKIDNLWIIEEIIILKKNNAN